MIRLALLQARRDRVVLPVWILGIVFLLFASASAVAAEFPTDAQRGNVLRLALATPALLALRGAPNGPGLGSMVFFESFTFLAVMAGLMNTFLATRHGRADEERGRRELVAAAPVARAAGLSATLLLGVLANLVLAALAAAGFAASGADVRGAIVAGVAIAAVGLAFLGVALLLGELLPTSRAANGLAATFVVAAYLLRGAGDATGTADFAALRLDPSWVSWLSPIGWGQQTYAFTDDNLWPVLLLLAFAALTAGTALVLRSRRDLGRALLPEPRGRATARPSLGGVAGLAWRLQWPTLTSWAVGSAAFGLLIGGLALRLADAAKGFPASVREVLNSLAHGGANDVISTFVTAVAVLEGLLAAAAGLQAVLRWREEEADGRAEIVLAAPLGRARWLLAGVAAGWLSVATVLVATALTTFLSFAVAADWASAWQSAGQVLVQGPAALAFVGLAALLVGWLPRASIAVAWGVFGLGAALGVLGVLLRVPDWVLDVDPVSAVPAVPFTDVGNAVLRLVLLLGTGIALAALGAVLVRRRDVPA